MSEGQITGSILVSSDAKNTDTNQEIGKSGIIIKKIDWHILTMI